MDHEQHDILKVTHPEVLYRITPEGKPRGRLVTRLVLLCTAPASAPAGAAAGAVVRLW